MSKTIQSVSSAKSELDRLIPIAELVQISSLSKATLYRQISDGTLVAPLKLGKHRIAWRLSDIEAWLKSHGRADIRQSEAA